jgi:hypothetical protein
MTTTVEWLATPRTRSTNGGRRRDWITHAVRNGHALCGLNAAHRTWEPRDDAKRCSTCATTDATHACATDLTALGVTYRQVDYWCRRGFLRPTNPGPGSGTVRVFLPAEYEVAVFMARAVAAGVSPDAAARAARHDGLLAPGVRLLLDDTNHA